MRTIAAAWESYRAKVIPKDAGEVQITECRRAFYAGAQTAMNLHLEITQPSISESAAMAMLNGLHDETERFGAEVAAGRA